MSVTSTLGIVRHYFDKRRVAAFASISVGSAVAGVLFPPVISSMLTKFGYKYTILYISPLFALNILAPILFIEQIPREKPKSPKSLFKSYVAAFRRYITPFFLLNSFLSYGAQLSIMILLFTHISNNSNSLQTAVISYSVYGFGALVSGLGLILVLLKAKLNCYIFQIIFNMVTGLGCCLIAAFSFTEVYYVGCGVLGFTHGGVLAIKGGLSIHLYHVDAIEYSYGLGEAVAGIGSFVFPVAGGYIQKLYGSSSGLYFLGVTILVGGLMLILAALIKKELWTSLQNEGISQLMMDRLGAIHTLVSLIMIPSMMTTEEMADKQDISIVNMSNPAENPQPSQQAEGNETNYSEHLDC